MGLVWVRHTCSDIFFIHVGMSVSGENRKLVIQGRLFISSLPLSLAKSSLSSCMINKNLFFDDIFHHGDRSFSDFLRGIFMF